MKLDRLTARALVDANLMSLSEYVELFGTPEEKEAGRADGLQVVRTRPASVTATEGGKRTPIGALVESVVARGPAQRAGIRTGDLIVAYERDTFKGVLDLPLTDVSTTGAAKFQMEGTIEPAPADSDQIKRYLAAGWPVVIPPSRPPAWLLSR